MRVGLLILLLIVGLPASAQQSRPAVSAEEQTQAEAVFARFMKIEPLTPEAFAGPDAALVGNGGNFLRTIGANTSPWARELTLRVARDQFWRSTANPEVLQKFGLTAPGAIEAFKQLTMPKWQETDAANTAWLKAEVDRRGAWPPISEVGYASSVMLWLLVQHADADKPFQKRALVLMEPLVATKEVSGDNYAYLWDRVAWGEGRPQRYATQGNCVAGKGAWEPFAVEDAANVDSRRAEAGLGPLADYVAGFASVCVGR